MRQNPATVERPAASKRATRAQRSAAVLLGLGICALVLYGMYSYGGGTQQCSQCGVEREARRLGPFWFHSWTRDNDRERWGWKGIPVCAEHSWTRAGCWNIDGGIGCYFGPVPPGL